MSGFISITFLKPFPHMVANSNDTELSQILEMMLFYSFSEILIDKVDFPNNFSKFCNAMS
jgi:hypothetical protein